MPAIITDVFKKKLIQKIFTDVSNDSDQFYIGIGKSEQWDSAETVPTPKDSPRTIRQVRSGLQSLKKTNDVTFTIPRYNWTPGIYNAYDDDFTEIPNTSYYVLTEDNQVYICLQHYSYSWVQCICLTYFEHYYRYECLCRMNVIMKNTILW